MADKQVLDDSMDLDEDSSAGPRLFGLFESILRTRSLDEAGQVQNDGEAINQHVGSSGCETDATGLNSSFDLSLLTATNGANQRNVSRPPPLRAAASWDENDPAGKDLTGRKHLRAHFSTDLPELPPPGTVRKASRRSVRSPHASTKTPVRHRVRPPATTAKKSTGKLTPASAKRHRVPLLHQRRSPLKRVPPKTPRESSLTRSAAAHTPRTTAGSPFVFEQDSEDKPYPFSAKKAPKASLGTVTTIGSSIFETTTESAGSIDASESSTPFRFTSFPASLPRITNASTGERTCPATVRKRMSFSDPNLLNGSREDDGTHNTSISSLQDDVQYGYSDDEESTSSTLGTPVARTRLNFASMLSPIGNEARMLEMADPEDANAMQVDADKVDLCRPYDPSRKNSFSSSVSSLTTLKQNLSGCDEIGAGSATGLTPSRTNEQNETPRVDSHRPETPQEVQLHFHLDAAQCSPIPGIPEEDGDATNKSDAVGSKEAKAHARLSTSRGSASLSDRSTGSRPMPDSAAFDAEASASRDRSADETTTLSSKSHPPSPKLLCPPTPVRTPAWAHSESGGHPMFKAGGHPKIGRSNSLIATKVLATCSPRVLDGRVSLETTVPENEVKCKSSVKRLLDIVLFDPAPENESDVDTIIEDDAQMDGESDEDGWLHHAQPSERQPVNASAATASAESGAVVSMATSFEILSVLGSGTFADVYKVRSKIDGELYAVKRNKRQFRGRRDREAALSEVRCMQRLQSVPADAQSKDEKSSFSQYLLFFFQAWQEDGHFFSQTELCCRDSCRELMDSLRSEWNDAKTRYPSVRHLPAPPGIVAGSDSDVLGRLVPEQTVWKICHDISAGLSHIHSHGLVHNDIKPSNMFFVAHSHFGAICKIGDFGQSGDIGAFEDGQEGDQKYMAPELLTSAVKHPSADIFSLGLTLYELASSLSFVVPSDGPLWHELRSGHHSLDIPSSRSADLIQLITMVLSSEKDRRPSADMILANTKATAAGRDCDSFLRDYIRDIESFDRSQEELASADRHEEQTPRNATRVRVCSPSMILPIAPMLYSPEPEAASS